MKRNIYKLKLWVIGADGESKFTDFYLDVNRIEGFYMPEEEEDEGVGITILVNGYFSTIKQQAHIERFLVEKFLEPSVINKRPG